MAAGPLLGGALVALVNWRAVFAVNVVIGIPAVVWSLHSGSAVVSRGRRLDIVGMSTAAVLIGGLVFALIEGPALGWLSPAVITAAGLAVAGAIGFVVAERSVKAPLLPVGVYSDPGFVSAGAQGALFNFAFYGLLFAMSLMLQQGRGLSALVSGLLFLPLTGLISIGTLCAAPLAGRIGRPAVLGVGQAVLAATLLAVAWASTSSALWPLVLALLPAGFFSARDHHDLAVHRGRRARPARCRVRSVQHLPPGRRSDRHRHLRPTARGHRQPQGWVHHLRGRRLRRHRGRPGGDPGRPRAGPPPQPSFREPGEFARSR